MILSVIIPCFNHGLLIQEAIDSVVALTGIDYEIIIVNDGSTDEYTIRELRDLESAGFTVLSHSNRGLAYTRNRGIEAATGKYILPLDADNKIKPEYVYKALPLLQSGTCDIVYAKPILFGDVSADRVFTTRSLNITELLMENYIDACAVYKKEVWTSIGGYDGQMPYQGQEDWEFWINAFVKGAKFGFLNEDLFYYRVVGNSMIATTSAMDKNSSNHQYIVKKHTSLFIEKYAKLYRIGKVYEHDVAHPLRSLFKFIYLNHFKKRKAIPNG